MRDTLHKICMSNKVLTALLIALLVLVACDKEGKQTVGTDNSNFSAVLLFTVDGCKVYRFYDGGAPHYFTTCQGSVSNTDKYGEHRIDTVIMPDTSSKF